jgi:muconolactone delta-isomerase
VYVDKRLKVYMEKTKASNPLPMSRKEAAQIRKEEEKRDRKYQKRHCVLHLWRTYSEGERLKTHI